MNPALAQNNLTIGVTIVSGIVKRSIVIDSRKTSISLEQEFWDGVKQIAAEKKLKLTALIAEIDRARTTGNLSSAVRVFVYKSYRK